MAPSLPHPLNLWLVSRPNLQYETPQQIAGQPPEQSCSPGSAVGITNGNGCVVASTGPVVAPSVNAAMFTCDEAGSPTETELPKPFVVLNSPPHTVAEYDLAVLELSPADTVAQNESIISFSSDCRAAKSSFQTYLVTPSPIVQKSSTRPVVPRALQSMLSSLPPLPIRGTTVLVSLVLFADSPVTCLRA